MEKVLITEIKDLFGGKALGLKFADNRSATAWNDKGFSEELKEALATKKEVLLELKPYNSNGRTGLNVIGFALADGSTATPVLPPVTKEQAVVNTVNKFRDDKQDSIEAQVMFKEACEFAREEEGYIDKLEEYLWDKIQVLTGAMKQCKDNIKTL